jgi:anti-sigma factor RsiW
MRFRRQRRSQEAELAALADGSLPDEGRAALEEEVARSPELAALLAEQQRAVGLVRRAAMEFKAPRGLRRRIELQQHSRGLFAPRRFVVGGACAVAAVTAAALLLTLPGNGAGSPTIAEAAVYATGSATEPAPATRTDRPTLLAQTAAGVPFPNWAPTFDWRATGVRVDTLKGRRVTTVFYVKRGKRIGYTIVAGAPLRAAEHAPLSLIGATDIRSFAAQGRPAVTWLRRGHTCVLSGAGVTHDLLLKLAAWTGKGTVIS